jgi:ankyrin repeat protein
LHDAAERGHLEAVALLVRLGAIVHAANSVRFSLCFQNALLTHASIQTGETPLHVAAKNGRSVVVAPLLNFGALADCVDAVSSLVKNRVFAIVLLRICG